VSVIPVRRDYQHELVRIGPRARRRAHYGRGRACGQRRKQDRPRRCSPNRSHLCAAGSSERSHSSLQALKEVRAHGSSMF
jgi:hypothetical protein